ncbi:MAG: flagella basal body P-ring formation protein FlgA [Novosphingobium sp.]
MKAVTAAITLAVSSPALAQSVTDLAAIDRAVESFTGAPIGAPGGAAQPVDRRLHLARCAAPPALSWYGSRRDTVLVRCPDPGSWRIFVPLSAGSAPDQAVPAVLRGESVTIAVSGEGFSVAQAGEALEPGAVGTWIRVRTAQAGTQGNAGTIRARVVRPGLVNVDIGNGLP